MHQTLWMNFYFIFIHLHAWIRCTTTKASSPKGRFKREVSVARSTCIIPYGLIFILFLYTCMLEYDVLPQKRKKPGWKPSSTTCFEKCSRGVLEASVQSPPDGVETWPKLLEHPPKIVQNKLYWRVFSLIFTFLW